MKSNVLSTVFILHILLEHLYAEEKFLEEPSNATLTEGQSYVLRCRVMNRVGELQWLRNEFGLGPGTEYEGYPRYRVLADNKTGQYDLEIRNIQYEDNARFECQVTATSQSKGLRSRKAFITVHLTPKKVWIDGGASVNVIENRLSNLSCQCQGAYPDPDIVWWSNNQPQLNDVHLTGSGQGHARTVNSLLTIRPTLNDVSRVYECVCISNATNTQLKSSTTLNVQYIPQTQILVVTSRDIREFEDLELTCQSKANPAVNQWRWYKNNDLLPDERQQRLYLSTLTRRLHQTNFTCETANDVGSSRASFKVEMKYGANITTTERVAETEVGEAATLICTTDSNPTSSVTWSRQNSNVIIATGHVLRIDLVTMSSFGEYVCKARVAGFADVSAIFYVIKRGAPLAMTVTEQLEQTVQYGGEAVLPCRMVASPSSIQSTTWHKHGGLLISNSMAPKYKVEEEWFYDGLLSTLIISDVTDSDITSYNCTSISNHGSTSLTFHLYRSDGVSVTYILAGVIPAVIIVVIIILVVIICCQRKSSASEVDSDSSECQITRQKDVQNGGLPSDGWPSTPPPLDVLDLQSYANDTFLKSMEMYQSTGHKYSPAAWRNDGYEPHNSDEEDLPKPPRRHSFYNSSYRSQPPDTLDSIKEVDEENVTETTRSSTLPRRNTLTVPTTFIPPPASPATSRLATNV